jgi:hypothetical protein
MPRSCGSLINELYQETIPVPMNDELVHAIDSEDTALFIWRERWFDREKNEPQLDRRHVNIVRADFNKDKQPRLLCISVGAIDNPVWVTAITNMTGFKVDDAQFDVTQANQVPTDQWQFLTDAAAKRMSALKQGDAVEDPQAPKQSSN